ncbi:uncharacterized protein LOC130417623 isoform X1 [Triplophysa dalaica]|uniref:uncharacterized protein LOC130417623 isoform X1 n=2 Tax=Triplophysa dalaica TaxID=1582913 RepID=UPI0024E01397|nr:uncharacterized protein LOC130417623 isoform X1 [Triplophysa dalaica]
MPGLPPCLGHDIFEGILSYDLALYLKYFIKQKKWFTYSILNRRIKQFKYSASDALSKPCTVSSNGVKLSGQAIQNWNFLRLLPVIMGDKVKEPMDDVWQLTLQLKDIVEMICAHRISLPDVAYLDVLIQEYLSCRFSLFPGHRLKPKHHYLRHYPALILKLGPLIRLWTMRFEKMGESEMNISSITSAIDVILPDLPITTKQSLEDTLKSLGVDTPEDFRFLQESDLVAVLRPIQARKFISVLKETTQISETPRQQHCPSQGSVLSQSSSSSSSRTSSPLSVKWVDSFEVPWKNFPEELMQALERQKRPSPQLRREMVRIVIAAMMKVCACPSRKNLTEVAKIMVAKYPKSLQDVIEESVIGPGYYSLVKQFQTRVENARRTSTPKIKKRVHDSDEFDTEEATPEKRAVVQDTYGCVNWEVKFMPLSETAESLQLKKEKMKSLSQTSDWNEKEVKDLMRSTYYCQRKDINKGKDMKTLNDEWPFLFQESGMEVHFKDLTGIPLKETFLESIDRKGNRLLHFMRNICANKNKRVLQAVAKLQVLRGQRNGCSEDVKDMILLLLSYFDEKEEVLLRYVEETSLAKDVELGNLPVTPCIIVCGPSCYAAVHFMLAVDRKIVNDNITSFISAVCLMLGSYYSFNIHYPTELASVLEFLQRCFFLINPEKGTKVVEKKNKKRLLVNPRVFTLISDLSDHEWRETS